MGTVVAPWLRDINLVEKPLSVGELAVSYASRGAEVDQDLWRRDLLRLAVNPRLPPATCHVLNEETGKQEEKKEDDGTTRANDDALHPRSQQS